VGKPQASTDELMSRTRSLTGRWRPPQTLCRVQQRLRHRLRQVRRHERAEHPVLHQEVPLQGLRRPEAPGQRLERLDQREHRPGRRLRRQVQPQRDAPEARGLPGPQGHDLRQEAPHGQHERRVRCARRLLVPPPVALPRHLACHGRVSSLISCLIRLDVLRPVSRSRRLYSVAAACNS
jgi:hypothetical protein